MRRFAFRSSKRQKKQSNREDWRKNMHFDSNKKFKRQKTNLRLFNKNKQNLKLRKND